MTSSIPSKGIKFLLDTHTFLWVVFDPWRLGDRARRSIENPDNGVFVSAASAWEMAIKATLGKLDMPNDLREVLDAYRFTPLDVRSEHALAVRSLPQHHRDPFDRLIIAQAKRENLVIITHDVAFNAYDVRTLPTLA